MLGNFLVILLYQTHIPTKWSDLSIKLRRKSIHEVDQTVEDEFMHSFSPGFVIMPLMANGRKVCLFRNLHGACVFDVNKLNNL